MWGEIKQIKTEFQLHTGGKRKGKTRVAKKTSSFFRDVREGEISGCEIDPSCGKKKLLT